MRKTAGDGAWSAKPTPCPQATGWAACRPSLEQHLQDRWGSDGAPRGKGPSKRNPRARHQDPGQPQTSWSVPCPARVGSGSEGPEMEDWAGQWGREEGLLGTEIFVPCLAPDIEWIRVCKLGGP